MSESKQRVFPLGSIASILLFIATVYFDIWSKLNSLGQTLLALALILLFFEDYQEVVRKNVRG